jgi:hypothetical protein
MNHATCKIHGHRVEAARLSNGRYNLGVDGRLVGTADTADEAVDAIAEAIRQKTWAADAPAVPQSFRETLAGLDVG